MDLPSTQLLYVFVRSTPEEIEIIFLSKYYRSSQSIYPRCGIIFHTSCEEQLCSPNWKRLHPAPSFTVHLFCWKGRSLSRSQYINVAAVRSLVSLRNFLTYFSPLPSLLRLALLKTPNFLFALRRQLHLVLFKKICLSPVLIS